VQLQHALNTIAKCQAYTALYLLLLLQHTLDYLGIPSPPHLPIRLPLSQPYLFVHSYSCEIVEEAGRDCGLLLYSTQGGWAALDGEGGSECGDPRPANMDPQVGREHEVHSRREREV
jgi:hypothetical protein